MMLSPEELLEARKKVPAIIPSLGEKGSFGGDEKINHTQLKSYLSCQEKLLLATRVKMKGSILRGVWHDDKKEAEVEEIVGNCLLHRGHTLNSKIYLYPEEALFLIDIGSLELFYNGLPMSLQRGYFVLLNNTGITLNQYRVYSHLSVLGYKIIRFSDSYLSKDSPNDNETEDDNSSLKQIPIIEKEEDDSQILKRLRDIGPQRLNCIENCKKGDFVISYPNRRKAESSGDTDSDLVVRILSCDDPVPDMMEMSNMVSDGSALPLLYAVVYPDTISFFLSSAVNIPIIL